MSSHYARDVLIGAAESLRRVSARTWLLAGLAFTALLGMIVWAGISLLSWLWSQGQSMSENGKQILGAATTQVEQFAPALSEQAGKWLPGLQDQINQWSTTLGASVPDNDVSGMDVGPVERYPGLIRSHFFRDGHVVSTSYSGRLPLTPVLAHYVEGFTSAGYAQNVVSASSAAEHHQFVRGREVFDLRLNRRAAGLLELSLTHTP
jgi:hypothetical protein